MLMRRFRRGGGGGDRGRVQGSGPPKNHTNVEFLSNTRSDPLENYKATKSAHNLGDHRHASEEPFK